MMYFGEFVKFLTSKFMLIFTILIVSIGFTYIIQWTDIEADNKINLTAPYSFNGEVEITWWKYGNSFNLLSGSVCYKSGNDPWSGGYQFLNWSRVVF